MLLLFLAAPKPYVLQIKCCFHKVTCFSFLHVDLNGMKRPKGQDTKGKRKAAHGYALMGGWITFHRGGVGRSGLCDLHPGRRSVIMIGTIVMYVSHTGALPG